MFLHSVLLCGLHALALAGPLTKPSTDSNVKLERGSCPSFWYDSGTDCYKYVSGLLPWADAELYCRSLGANLASIHNASEMNFITTLIENFDPTKGYHWIGFSDSQKEGAWMWSDGSRGDFASWSQGQPDNHHGVEDCAHIYWNPMDPAWNDEDCTYSFPSVCKLRKTCP
ncbi:unnamed protein product [Arctogadus glacialis]